MSAVDTSFADDRLFFRWFYRLGVSIVSVPFGWYTRLSIHGRDNIPAEGPFILAPVHRSFVDTPVMTRVTNRRLRFMGKDSMWKYRRLGRVFSALGAFPVSRGSADREAMQRALRILDEFGEGLVLFPEGERKSGPRVHPLLDGAIYLAVKAGVPIIPVGIGGSEWVMPKSARFVHPKRIQVEIGEPIMPPTPPDGKRRVPREAYAQTAELLRERIQELFDLAMSEVPQTYDDPPTGSDTKPAEEAVTTRGDEGLD